MTIYTEFSGFGYSGICSLVPRYAVPQLVEAINSMDVRARKGDWANPEFDTNAYRAVGINECFHVIKGTDPETIRLAWNPKNFSDCMHSLCLLRSAVKRTQGMGSWPDLSLPVLDLACDQTDSTCAVRANFGAPIWELLEKPHVAEEVFPGINHELQLWHQEQRNTAAEGQFCTYLPTGTEGARIEIRHGNHPSYQNEMGGSRRRSPGADFQMIDSTGCTETDAHAHIVALCIILKHCRTALGS